MQWKGTIIKVKCKNFAYVHSSHPSFRETHTSYKYTYTHTSPHFHFLPLSSFSFSTSASVHSSNLKKSLYFPLNANVSESPNQNRKRKILRKIMVACHCSLLRSSFLIIEGKNGQTVLHDCVLCFNKKIFWEESKTTFSFSQPTLTSRFHTSQRRNLLWLPTLIIISCTFLHKGTTHFIFIIIRIREWRKVKAWKQHGNGGSSYLCVLIIFNTIQSWEFTSERALTKRTDTRLMPPSFSERENLSKCMNDEVPYFLSG